MNYTCLRYIFYISGVSVFGWILTHAISVTTTGNVLPQYTLLWWFLAFVNGAIAMYVAEKLTGKNSQ